MNNISDMLLYYTQIHLKGISESAEQKNWIKGVLNLKSLYDKNYCQIKFFEEENPIIRSIDELKKGNLSNFIQNLDKSQYYRIAFSFPERVMFLDIETTGLSKVYSYITLIGWYIDGKYKHHLYGNDLNEFIEDLKNIDVIVTFNGSIFDLPFLKSQYVKLKEFLDEKAHIDLRFLMKKYDFSGGQKFIENQLGFKRPKTIENSDGKEAISLWYGFLNNNNKCLEKLLYYNCYDILGMVFLLNYVFYNKIYGVKFPKVGKPIPFKRKFKKVFLNYNEIEVEIAKTSVANNISFFKHTILSDSFNDVVIGIDLTGSEKKPSGVALICGNEVKTSLIFSDDDIIEYVVKNKCNLVSIDSPLSLPEGRISAFDDDPNRQTAGIMRICERKLKKRGVNAYPALIPSMQKLTQRGILISNRLRKLGIPVIESFPGAAQDVLQIPRKRTDIHYLKKGLIDFGVRGEFIEKNVSHDELDAITSALVGQFFISDYYDKLGSRSENYLIIPAMYKRDKQVSKVIGLCGPIASGKTEAGKYIEKSGYKYIRYSKVISDYIEEIGETISRKTLQSWGEKIYNEFGQYWLNNRLIKNLTTQEYIVIDGVRHMEDMTFLKEEFYNNFILIYIESDYETRVSRYNDKNNDKYDEIVSHNVEKSIPRLKNKADYIIKNNSTLEDLYNKIDLLIKNKGV